MTTNTRRSADLSLLVVSSGIFAAGAQAQALEEITVTATKRGDTAIQETPLSIQAIDGSALEEAGALDFNEYYRRIPGLSVNDQGPGDKRYIIRGINSAGTGTVGLYFDEIVVTGDNLASAGGRQADVKLFDMERIEVLRGPQGTTFGSSALSGAIRWLPRSVDLDETAFSIGAGVTSTAGSDGIGWQIDGSANFALADGRFGVRVAGLKLDKKGYIDNRFLEDGNNDDSEAVRAMAKWRISDSLMLDVLLMNQRSITNARPFYHLQDYRMNASPSLRGAPLPLYYNADLTRGLFDDEINMGSARLTFERDWGSITGVASFFDRDSYFERDASATVESQSAGTRPADGSGRSLIAQPRNDGRDTLELRFASNFTGPVQLLAGAFSQKDRRYFQSRNLTASPVTGQTTPTSFVFLDRDVDTRIEEVAAFADVSWSVTERLTANIGARWFEFDIAERATSKTSFPGVPGTGRGPPLAFTESDVITRFNLSYDFTPDVMVYVQAAEGFRSGGTNDTTIASSVGVTIPPGFESDSVWNYEVGLKSMLLDRRLRINGAVYRIDWSNIQVRQTARSAQGLNFAYRANGGEAKVDGVELELAASISEAFEIGAALNYSDGKLTENLPLASEGVSGDVIPYVPDFTWNLNARYEWPLSARGFRLFASGDWAYTGEQTTVLRPNNVQYRKLNGYSLVNARIGVTGERWSATLGVDNVLDEDETSAYVFDFGGSTPNGVVPDGLVRPWPRTVALSFRMDF